MSKTKKKTKTKTKTKPKTKSSFKQIEPKFDWSKKFKLKSVKRSIAEMVNACMMIDKSLLSPDMKDDDFATVLVAYSPHCANYLPSNVVINHDRVKSLTLIHQLAADSKKKESPWSPQPNVKFIASAIALMSKGVSEIRFSYSGGSDEISSSDDVMCEWIDREYDSWDNQLKDSSSIFEWLESDKERCSAIDMLYSFLDDTGAGPPEYSQSFKITFFKWGCELYDYEEDEPWEDND